MKILVTGSAGFIGSNLVESLLKDGHKVIGIDNMNDYYDPKIKEASLIYLSQLKLGYVHYNYDLTTDDINIIFKYHKFDIIFHLASYAGVSYSLENPNKYFHNNIESTVNLLELCRKYNIQKFIYASSSSVYGSNTKIPFSEDDIVNQQISPYAISKLVQEEVANLYNRLYNITTVGLRFFTVYGERGRPDMAPYKFIKAIAKNIPITVYGDGTSTRDFTYIDDIVAGIKATITKSQLSPIYNLGNSHSYSINTLIEIIEKVVGKKAQINYEPDRQGDVPHTCANITRAQSELDYKPQMILENGLRRQYNWMKIHGHII